MMKQREIPLTKEEELELGIKIQKFKALEARIESGYNNTLTAEEEKVISEGNYALAELVSNYLNLARSIAHKYHKKTGTRYDIEDLLQDAVSALVEAACSYEPEKNCKLSTYAFYGITKRVSTTINYQRTVRLPENKMGEYIKISEAKLAYSKLSDKEKLSKGSELEFVYENVGELKRSEVDLILTNMQPQISLNANIYDGAGEFGDLIEDKNASLNVIEYGNLNESITTLVDKLTEYEKDLIAFEYGLFPSSVKYSDFLIKHDIDDRKVKFETKRVVKKMKSIAESVGM